MKCSLCGAPLDGRDCQTYSILFDSGTVCAQDELLSSRSKLYQACDGQVFMIEVWVFAQDLICL